MQIRQLTRTDISTIISYLNKFVPLRISQIYEIEKRKIVFKVQPLNKELNKLYITFDLTSACPCIYTLSKDNFVAPKYPSSLCMKLRKHLNNKIIDKIEIYGLDRVIDITVGDSYKVIVELFDQGNLLLLDKEDKILTLIRRHIYDKDIGTSVGWKYPWEQLNKEFNWESLDEHYNYFKDWTQGKIRDLLVNSKSPIIWLGSDFIKHICFLLDIKMSWKPNKLTQYWYITFLDKCKEEYQKIGSEINIKGYYSNEKIFSYPWKNLQEPVEIENFCEEIKKIWHKNITIKNKKDNKKEVKLSQKEKIDLSNKNRLESLQNKIDSVDNQIIYFTQHEEMFSFLNFKNILYNDIIKKKNNKDIEFDNKEIKIILKADLNYWQNLTELHSMRKKIKYKYDKVIAGNKMAIEKLEKSKKSKKQQVKKIELKTYKPYWYEEYHWFYTSNNLLVVAGKNSNQNEQLVKKYMKKTDLYFHSTTGGSPSTLLIDGREETNIKVLLEVACFVSSLSSGWKSKSPDKVYYVNPEQVSKTPESGEYIQKGSFIIRGKKIFLEGDLSLAIGLYFRNKEGLQLQPDNEEYIPVWSVGPWKSLQKLKFRSRILPGDKKRGKIVKNIIDSWNKRKDINLLERRYLKSLISDKVIFRLPMKIKAIY